MANTTNFNWETPDDTDLVKDGAAAIRTLGSAIDTSLVDLKGGTTGQVLSKTSNTDMDFTWVAQDDSNAIQNAIIDAKGDLIVGSAADTPARLAVGTNGYTLVADSAETTGLKWAAPAGGGKILQVVQATYSTQATNSTATFADTGLSASITPASSSNKVLVLVTNNFEKTAGSGDNACIYKLVRASTDIFETTFMGYQGSAVRLIQGFAMQYLDSPSTTSSTTYKLQFKNFNNGASVLSQVNGATATIILMEVGA
jgi:hypothetical protein